jgi:hypothetical protein
MSHLTQTVRPLSAVPRLPGPLRLGMLFAALALAVGIFASVLTGSASAATVNRQVVSQPNSFLYVHDDESWPFSDEERTFDMSNLGWGIVSPANPLQERGTSGCAGDEVHVEYQVRTLLSQTSPGTVTVKVSAQLYEGTDCSSRDLDGTASMSFTIAPGQTVGKTLNVFNQDEGGDYGTVHLVLKNTDA